MSMTIFGRRPFGLLRPAQLCAIVVVLGLAAAAAIWWIGGATHRVTVTFPSAKSLYTGSDVRLLGMRIGEIQRVEPSGDGVRVTLSYDAEHHVPADAQAVLVAPALVTSRYVEFAADDFSGPAMADGAVIGPERTAVPVEFDDIKDQLNELTSALGPDGANSSGAVNRMLDTAAGYEGLGKPFHETIEQLSEAMGVLSQNRGNLFATVRNLQVFVSALAASDRQIADFITRLNDVSGVLDENKGQLAAALRELDTAAGQVERFVRKNRDQLTDGAEKLDDVVRVLAENRPALENALHVLPTVLTNVYGIYDGSGSFTGVPAVSNFANPAQFVCSAVGAATGTRPVEAGRLCSEHLGPLLGVLQMDYPPVSVNPLIADGQPERQGAGPGRDDRQPEPEPELGAQPHVDTLDRLLNPSGGR